MIIPRSRRLATIGLLSAVTLISNYSLFPLPNVKLMDVIVFASSYVMGLTVGISVITISWFIYGTLNPLGAAGFPLILILILSETVYALAGWIASGRLPIFGHSNLLNRGLAFGFIGLLCALIYDLITNAFWGLIAYSAPGRPLTEAMLLAIVVGIPFSMIHQISNFVFFSTLGLLLIRLLMNNLPIESSIKRPKGPHLEG